MTTRWPTWSEPACRVREDVISGPAGRRWCALPGRRSPAATGRAESLRDAVRTRLASLSGRRRLVLRPRRCSARYFDWRLLPVAPAAPRRGGRCPGAGVGSLLLTLMTALFGPSRTEPGKPCWMADAARAKRGRCGVLAAARVRPPGLPGSWRDVAADHRGAVRATGPGPVSCSARPASRHSTGVAGHRRRHLRRAVRPAGPSSDGRAQARGAADRALASRDGWTSHAGATTSLLSCVPLAWRHGR